MKLPKNKDLYFSDDVKSLRSMFVGIDTAMSNNTSLNISISLQTIFSICPRNRCRVDRYFQLIKYLKTKNINLTVYSKKQK